MKEIKLKPMKPPFEKIKETLKEHNQKLKEKQDIVKKEVVGKMSTLIVSAFGLAAALAWNDTIKVIITKIFGTPNEISSMITYAIIVTVMAVIATLIVGRLAERLQK